MIIGFFIGGFVLGALFVWGCYWLVLHFGASMANKRHQEVMNHMRTRDAELIDLHRHSTSALEDISEQLRRMGP